MSKKTFGFIYMYALYVCMYKWVCGICDVCECVRAYLSPRPNDVINTISILSE